MRGTLLILLVTGAMLTGCSQPTPPSDTNHQQGNPQAQPEKSADPSNRQPADDQAGKDAHTQARPDSKKQ